MALTRERAVSALLPAPVDPDDPTARPTRRPVLWLLVVAATYVTTMLVVVAPRVALGWDETLYASQVSPRVPAGFFSAPRARGVTYLVAPVVYFTSSTVALRRYLAVLAGVLLVAGFWPWLRVFRRPATAHHEDAVYISHRPKPPAFLHGWRRHPLPTPQGEHQWFAYTPPWEPTK